MAARRKRLLVALAAASLLLLLAGLTAGGDGFSITAAPHMSSMEAGSSTTLRPTVSPLNSPSSASWLSGDGATGGAPATLAASVSNSGAHSPPGRPMIS